jgi:hypothetical protein
MNTVKSHPVSRAIHEPPVPSLPPVPRPLKGTKRDPQRLLLFTRVLLLVGCHVVRNIRGSVGLAGCTHVEGVLCPPVFFHLIV